MVTNYYCSQWKVDSQFKGKYLVLFFFDTFFFLPIIHFVTFQWWSVFFQIHVDLTELDLALQYLAPLHWHEKTDEETRARNRENAEKAFKSTQSTQVSHLSTFQFMAQDDFDVNIEWKIIGIGLDRQYQYVWLMINGQVSIFPQSFTFWLFCFFIQHFLNPLLEFCLTGISFQENICI